MAREPVIPGGELEYDVLHTVWQVQPATIGQIHEVVGEPHGYAYTTTATILDRLKKKGLVNRRRGGNRWVWYATVEKAVVERARAREALAQILGDDPAAGLEVLVDALASINKRHLDALSAAVTKRKRARKTKR